MIPKSKLTEDLKRLKHIERKDEDLIHKLSEFMELLQQSDLDSENIAEIKETLNDALEDKLNGKDALEKIQQISVGEMPTLDQLDQLEFLLNTNHLDSKQAKRITYNSIFLKIVKVVIGILFTTLGFAMIIMPAPPYFEMFTIFYFTENDGVTLMDLISLIIIAIGIYIIVKSFSNMNSYE